MARITVEDALKHVNNRFILSILASERSKQLINGVADPLVKTDNKEIVTALREIAKGHINTKKPFNREPEVQ